MQLGQASAVPALDPMSSDATQPDSKQPEVMLPDSIPPDSIRPDSATQESIVVGYPGRYALLLRKQFIIGMNYFDQRFGEYWADADLALQIRRTQRKIRVYPSITAMWHAPADSVSDTLHDSDRILGAAHLLGKYEGVFAGMMFRIAAVLGALLRFKFGLLSALLGGKRLGDQAN